MKVLLINPPDINMIRTNLPAVLDSEEHVGYYPPIGLLYVAAHAEKETNYKIEVLDTLVEELDYDGIEKEIIRRQPDVVGIQTMTFTLIDVIKTARVVKKVNKNIHVCLGGPHINLYPDETIAIPEIDSLVLGEGEHAFADLLKCLDSNSELAKVKGIVFQKNGKIINPGARPMIENLDTLVHPARNLIPIEKYWSVLAKNAPITTSMTSRGCPFKCIFCDRPFFGKSFRFRSAKNVVDEMEECVKVGIREFVFYDDTFTIDRKRVYGICEEIEKRKLDVFWSVRARVAGLDEKILMTMRKAGCIRIHFGVESGNEEILKVMKKGITLEEIRTAFKLAKKVGMTTLGYFMLGNPSETREQMMETIEFANTLNADYANFALTTPYPATELYQMGFEEGIIEDDYWREFAKNPTEEFAPRFWGGEGHLAEDELMEMLVYSYKSFYRRPRYMLNQLLQVRSWAELKRKIKAGLLLLRNTEFKSTA
jgi:radical SAM superfamily enzyme YgiQ (UPF0313 family)|tara:strand:- start:2639 stop:4084 length:1446 start_codon:yes stop_codon:yes gene_type:complete